MISAPAARAQDGLKSVAVSVSWPGVANAPEDVRQVEHPSALPARSVGSLAGRGVVQFAYRQRQSGLERGKARSNMSSNSSLSFAIRSSMVTCPIC